MAHAGEQSRRLVFGLRPDTSMGAALGPGAMLKDVGQRPEFFGLVVHRPQYCIVISG